MATDLAFQLSKFLTEYLPATRNASPNTTKGYRDAFTLLLRYCRDVRRMALEKLGLQDIDADLLLEFLGASERERGWAPSTRNHRLAAFHSFFRYLQSEQPEHLLRCQRILAIPMQRCPRPSIPYLEVEELAALLQQPDVSTPMGRRDKTLLLLLYDTGARVQEVVDLHPRDLQLTSPAFVRLTGKGRKTRVVPLMTGTVAKLRVYFEEHGLDDSAHNDGPLFRNRLGSRLTRSGIRDILRKYVESAGDQLSSGKRISPHTLRHSKAMHLLQSGAPLVVIRNILGHEDVKSTEIYAKADLAMKRKALERAALHSGAAAQPAEPSWKMDADLLAWLRSL